MIDPENDVIGVIEKSRAEDVRVFLSSFVAQRPSIHIRTFARYGDGPDRGPTRKGASLPVDALPELIDLLSRALDRARERGLITGDAHG